MLDNNKMKFDGEPCCLFDREFSPMDISSMRVIKDYEDTYYNDAPGQSIRTHKNDDFSRKVLQCPNCGALFLRHETSDSCEYYQVQDITIADYINIKLQGDDIRDYNAPHIIWSDDGITACLPVDDLLDNMDPRDLNLKLHEAIRFAEEMHRGQVRKGSGAMYIIHPMEVLQILMRQRCNIEVAIAGVLHDTVEDTSATIDQISQRFGNRVAQLVYSHTEHKQNKDGDRIPWRERKLEALEHLRIAHRDDKQIVLADSISNLRSLVYDYRIIGEELWDRFNALKDDIAWYYNNKLDIFEEFSEDEVLKESYDEFNSLFKHLFASFHISYEDRGRCIYQVICDKIYVICENNPKWELTDVLPESTMLLQKTEAAYMEDQWKAVTKA